MEHRPAHALAVAAGRVTRRKRPKSVPVAADVRVAKRILLVKPHDQLGDFLIATSAMAALRKRYRDATIALVTRDYLAALARHVPFLDRLWVLPRMRSPGDVLRAPRIAAEIARFRPDITFVLNSPSRSRTADLLAVLSGARIIVGRSRVGTGPLSTSPPAPPSAAQTAAQTASAADPIYDLDVDFGPASTHQVDRLFDLVRFTGATRERRMVFELSAAERSAGERVLAGALPGARAPRVGMHPAAANALKCWPIESFAELGAALARDEPPASIFVYDTPKEPGSAHALVGALGSRGIRPGLIEPRPLDAFAATLAPLDLLVCNDSGVMHLAAALGVPTLSLHSLGRPEEWAPQNASAIALHAEAIAGIPVLAALEAARSMLHRREANPPAGDSY